MSFFYAILLKLLYPTSVAILLLLVGAALRRRKCEKIARVSFWTALTVLLVCGNGWVVRYSTRYLERRYQPLPAQLVTVGSALPASPQADCIVVLGGGIWPQMPPRPTVEVSETGDRLLYAIQLFRSGMAPKILCTAGIPTSGLRGRPGADMMAELLENLGVPNSAILRETESRNTHEHGKYLYPMFQEKGYHRILLVTSAAHMPRSMGVLKRACPGIEFIPAPTDFRYVDLDSHWYGELVNLVPTPGNYVQFCSTMHEYFGIAYYRMRGWM